MAANEVVAEKITNLSSWGWAFLPDGTGGGSLIMQSPSGIERIVFWMDAKTVIALRRDLMGIASVN